jgi:hypothetical protein
VKEEEAPPAEVVFTEGVPWPEPVSGRKVEFRTRLGGRTFRVTFVSATPLAASGDLDLIVSLIPAMTVGDPLRIAGPVSPRLLSNVPRLQELYCHGDRHNPRTHRKAGLRTIAVEADVAVRPSTDDRGVAAFFTGGLDSSYTAVKHRDEITSLVFVEGFDVNVFASEQLRSEVRDGVRRGAAMLGLPLVEVRTDLRFFAQEFVRWGDYNGAALASLALLLRDSFRTVYIPASVTFSHLQPLGSHPLLDPLWSTEDVEIVHDGCEANRLEKAELIAARMPALLRDLRVCLENTDDTYNCGRCRKCVLTMTALRLAGATHLCETLPVLEMAQFEDIAPGYDVRSMWEQMRETAEDRDPELAEALRRALLKLSE